MTAANELLARLKAKEAEDKSKADRREQALINILSSVKFYDPCDTLEDNIEAYIEAQIAKVRQELNKAFNAEYERLETQFTRLSNPMMRRIL
ncbi:hypothetical protein AB4383_07995 [Vibrio breoganii]